MGRGWFGFKSAKGGDVGIVGWAGGRLVTWG